MKTAVSVPDAIFHEAERLARSKHCSRSELYSRALADYVARHSVDRVTEAMDRVLESLEPDSATRKAERFTAAAAARVLKANEW